MWESGAFCPISKRGGKIAFGVFHRASFPPRRFWISVRTERSDAAALAAVVTSKPANFEVEAHFSVHARKKSRLEGRRRIFLSLPVVWVMAFFGMGIDASVFAIAIGSPIAQDPFPWSSLRAELPFNSIWCALWTNRSRMLSARVGSPICSCQRLTGTWLVRIVECSW
jgi:hypothetical protein